MKQKENINAKQDIIFRALNIRKRIFILIGREHKANRKHKLLWNNTNK